MTAMQKRISFVTSKKDNELRNLSNRRPLTLLNTVYKFITKTISNRIKKIYITKIIEQSQTGFTKGRYIGENIRLIQETVVKLEDENLPGLLLFADFEKVFDSISHEFMFNCLKCFNFGSNIINWIKCFYNDAKSD